MACLLIHDLQASVSSLQRSEGATLCLADLNGTSGSTWNDGSLTLRSDVRVDDQLVEVVRDLDVLVLPERIHLLPALKALPDVLWKEVRPFRVHDLERVSACATLH